MRVLRGEIYTIYFTLPTFMVSTATVLGLRFFLIVFLMFSRSIWAEPYKVGTRTLPFTDDTRDRAVATQLWYPTSSPKAEKQITKTPFLGYGVQDGELDTSLGDLPLVVVSHGNGSRKDSLSWVTHQLASQGYLVAAPDHQGNTWKDSKPHTHYAVWERAGDLNFLLETLLADNEWKGAIDRNRIGALGYSLGGATVLMLVGGKYRHEQWEQHCNCPNPDSECRWWATVKKSKVDFTRADLDYRNPLVKSAVLFNPAVIPGFTVDSLTNIKVPVQVISSGEDQYLDFETYSGLLGKVIPGVELTKFDFGSHYVFLSPTNALGLKAIPVIHASQQSTGIERAQSLSLPLVTEFVNRTVCGRVTHAAD